MNEKKITTSVYFSVSIREGYEEKGSFKISADSIEEFKEKLAELEPLFESFRKSLEDQQSIS